MKLGLLSGSQPYYLYEFDYLSQNTNALFEDTLQTHVKRLNTANKYATNEMFSLMISK